MPEIPKTTSSITHQKEIEIRTASRFYSNSIIEMLIISDAISKRHNMESKTTLMHCIVGIMQWEAALPHVKRAISELSPSSDLYITDPYIFTPANIPEDIYVECLLSLFESVTFGNVYFFTPQGRSHFKSDIFNQFSTRFNNSARTSHLIACDCFHDRFWVSSECGAFSIGCSVNGLGKRVCVLNRLNAQDYVSVLNTLKSKV